MRAIIFDLFGTLTDATVELSRRAMVEQTAAELGIEPNAFWSHWSASFPQRITGGYGGTEQTIRRLAQECAVPVEARALAAALRVHRSAMEQIRAPRAGALELLDELRQRRWRLALMSDCSSEVAEAWDTSPYATRFDASVLSFKEGMRKPDRRLYEVAARRLGVATSECWYIGDGGGREHSGARAAGMQPVLITNAAVPGAAVLRADADDFRPELTVDDLGEIPHLVGHPVD